MASSVSSSHAYIVGAMMRENVGDVFSIAKSSDVLTFTAISKVPFIPRGFCGALDVKVDVDY